MTMRVTELYDFLVKCDSGVVSTIGSEGEPQSARVYIVATPELQLIFYTLQTNRKCLNLRRDPRIAAAVGLEDKWTIQYEGLAMEANEYTHAEVRKIYMHARPQQAGMLNWPGLTFFRVKPIWIRFSDYGQPWRIEEMSFPENKPVKQRSRNR